MITFFRHAFLRTIKSSVYKLSALTYSAGIVLPMNPPWGLRGPETHDKAICMEKLCVLNGISECELVTNAHNKLS